MKAAAAVQETLNLLGYYLVHDTSPIGLHENPENKGPAYELRDANFNRLYSANLKQQANRLEQTIELRSCTDGPNYILSPKRKVFNLSYIVSRCEKGGHRALAELSRKKGAVQLVDLNKKQIARSVSMLPDRVFMDYVVDVLDQDFSKDPQKEYQIESGGVVVGRAESQYVPKPESEIVVSNTRWKLLNKVLNSVASKNYSTVYIELAQEFSIDPALLMAFAIGHHYFCVVDVKDNIS